MTSSRLLTLMGIVFVGVGLVLVLFEVLSLQALWSMPLSKYSNEGERAFLTGILVALPGALLIGAGQIVDTWNQMEKPR